LVSPLAFCLGMLIMITFSLFFFALGPATLWSPCSTSYSKQFRPGTRSSWCSLQCSSCDLGALLKKFAWCWWLVKSTWNLLKGCNHIQRFVNINLNVKNNSRLIQINVLQALPPEELAQLLALAPPRSSPSQMPPDSLLVPQPAATTTARMDPATLPTTPTAVLSQNDQREPLAASTGSQERVDMNNKRSAYVDLKPRSKPKLVNPQKSMYADRRWRKTEIQNKSIRCCEIFLCPIPLVFPHPP
jgi:hypothetical protein